MRTVFVFLLMVISHSSIYAQTSQIVGTWTGVCKDQETRQLSFNPDGKLLDKTFIYSDDQCKNLIHVEEDQLDYVITKEAGSILTLKITYSEPRNGFVGKNTEYTIKDSDTIQENWVSVIELENEHTRTVPMTDMNQDVFKRNSLSMSGNEESH